MKEQMTDKKGLIIKIIMYNKKFLKRTPKIVIKVKTKQKNWKIKTHT